MEPVVATRTVRMNQQDEIMLGMLTAIYNENKSSQRALAQTLGIAVGLVNAYLKRCVRKGLVKIEQAPVRRYAYYLTPKGFAEKSRLTTEFLTVSLDYFRQARRECGRLVAHAKAQNWQRLALVGAGDLAEVAVLSASEAGVQVVAIVDSSWAGRRCAGRPVVSELHEAVHLADALIFTAMDQIQLQHSNTLAAMRAANFPESRLLVPAILGLRGSDRDLM